MVVTNASGCATSSVAWLNVNRAPQASLAGFTRAPGISLKISVTNLLATYTRDEDGDPVTLSSVGVPGHGSLTQASDWLIYEPDATDVSDSFGYTIADGRGGSASGTVQITRVTNGGQAQSIAPGPDGVSLRFAGVPGFRYAVERAASLEGAWTAIHTTNAPPAGVFLFTDQAPPSGGAFYRLSYQP